MHHGNIYPADKVPGALAGFFRTENLTALRELVLRFVADETEEELLAYLEDHVGDDVWETTERIMVAVTDAPGTDVVVRRAARIAARLKTELHVVHVRGDDRARPTSPAVVTGLEQLASDVGAMWHVVEGDDAAKSLVGFAAEHQITQIVIGASERSRIEALARSSVVTRLLRFASATGVDVHVIARRDRQH